MGVSIKYHVVPVCGSCIATPTRCIRSAETSGVKGFFFFRSASAEIKLADMIMHIFEVRHTTDGAMISSDVKDCYDI